MNFLRSFLQCHCSLIYYSSSLNRGFAFRNGCFQSHFSLKSCAQKRLHFACIYMYDWLLMHYHLQDYFSLKVGII